MSSDAFHPIEPREVSADIALTVLAPTTLEFQIALTYLQGADVTESIQFSVNGIPVSSLELVGDHGGRIHRFDAGVGSVRASYSARVVGVPTPPPLNEWDRSLYLRPSRYAEVDKFFGFAAKQFGTGRSTAELVVAVVDYVAQRLDYVPGSSDPIDGAVDTLLAGAGVCRDYAHLVVALLRAQNVPARVVSVYAPGCDPMDFHAVAEVLIDDAWYVVDATGLAPRQSLLRIATGRDCADTAFLDNHGGAIQLDEMMVTASVAGELPVDPTGELVQLG